MRTSPFIKPTRFVQLLYVFLVTGVVVMTADVQRVSAQRRTPDVEYSDRYSWISGGIGGAQTGFGLTASAGTAVQDPYFVGGRFAHTEKVLRPGAPRPRTWDAGPLFGLVHHGRYGHVSFASGVAIVGNREIHRTKRKQLGPCAGCDPGYKRTHLHTIGIPLDVQAVFTPHPNLGIGVHGYATVSGSKNLLGVSIQLLARASE